MRLHNLNWLKTRRRSLRTSLTPAEARLWKYLKVSRLLERKFCRQHSAGRYILDFYCPSEKLAIELDGTAHDCDFAQKHDWIRDRFLRDNGIRVLRFQNDDVMTNLDGVLSEIRRHFNHPGASRHPS
jgi:very-short-patch-repair endonuclease